MRDEPKTAGKPAKKGRVGKLVDAEKKARRRSSLGGGISLSVPGIPGMCPSPLVYGPPSTETRSCHAAVAKPPKAVFMFGNGDMGQLGLGPDTLDEIPRPRLHAWFAPLIDIGIYSY